MSKKKIAIIVIAVITALAVIAAGVTGGVLANKIQMPKDDIEIVNPSPKLNIEYDRFLSADRVDKGENPTIYIDSLNGKAQAFLHLGGTLILYINIESSNNGQKLLFEHVGFYKSGDKQILSIFGDFRSTIEVFNSSGLVENIEYNKDYEEDGRYRRKSEYTDINKIDINMKIHSPMPSEREVKIIFAV